MERPSAALGAAEIDDLIVAAAALETDEGLDHLAAKLDHLIHALRQSGRLARLSSDQVVNMAYALRASGHTQMPPLKYLTYNQDGLASAHNADLLRDPRFIAAYQRGVEACGEDHNWHWRVHVALWAATHAARLTGDFVEFANVEIIRGSIPTTLRLAQTSAVCFLHVDMNCVVPEVAAVTYFWDRIVPGGVVLLDDYGFRSLEPQKRGIDAFAAERCVEVLSLPTGQGLILKAG